MFRLIKKFLHYNFVAWTALSLSAPIYAQDSTPATTADAEVNKEDPAKAEKKAPKKKKSSKKVSKKGGKKKGKKTRPAPFVGYLKGKKLKGSEAVCFFDKKGEMIQCGVVTPHKTAKEKYKINQFKKYADEVALTPSFEKSEAKSGNAPRMWVLYNPAIISATTSQNLGYKKSAVAAPRDSLWDSAGASDMALFSLGMQVKVPLGESFGLLPGMRYRAKNIYVGDSNYDEPTIDEEADPDGVRQQKIFARINQEESAYGFWLDFQYLSFSLFKDAQMFLTSGLDIEQSSLKFTATRLDDAKEFPTVELAKLSSDLTVLSARIGVGFDYLFYGSLGLHLGVNVMVPLYGMGGSDDARVEDQNTNFLSRDPAEDLLEQLGHSKASFGAEISFGIVHEL